MRLRVGHQHSWFLSILVRFMHYYILFLGLRVISTIDDSGPFRALLLTVLGSREISTIDDPGGAFTCPSSTLIVWPILTRFVDYYSPFCGPQAISKVVEPQVAVMCRSSTLAVLADSGPFLGLLLTVLGSHSDFHSC